jgi:hypothetical protein
MSTPEKYAAIRFGTLLVLTSLFLFSCAKQGTLSGGPRDLQPPRLDTTLSDRNFQTRFYPRAIRLYFDEWIQLKNPSQILLSPPLQYSPEISSRGKHVDIVFDEEEVLRDSTTYTINFGDAIVDFTESNPLSNFRFVFATGDKIDSLSLRAKVIDSYTRQPVKDVSVMLYDLDRDSIVYEEQPYYFARTDKEGSCTIQNIRKGRFKVFALLDKDFNFLYNQDSEQIGFVDTLVRIDQETGLRPLEIELFLPLPGIQIIETGIPRRGKARLLVNQPVDTFRILETNVDLIDHETLYDSLFIWYHPDTTQRDSIFLVLELDGKADTITIRSKSNVPAPAAVLFQGPRSQRMTLNPGMPGWLEFNQVISTLDTSRIELLPVVQAARIDTTEAERTDSIPPPPDQLEISLWADTVEHRKVFFSAELEEKKSYRLTLYPGAVKGYFDNQNDTLVTLITAEARENLGNIICRFDSLDGNQQYLVLLKKNKTVEDTRIIRDTMSQELRFLLLKPGKFYLEVIVDENRNGRWDPGNYAERRQSERKLEIQLEELRKNWDIETEIKWDSP